MITPVTNRTSERSRTTHVDMNRIVSNMREAGGHPVKNTYVSSDIVTKAEWDAIWQFAKLKDNTITSSTRYDNLNKIERAIMLAHGSKWNDYEADTWNELSTTTWNEMGGQL